MYTYTYNIPTGGRRQDFVALPVRRYLSNTASFVSLAFRSAKDHSNLLYGSPLLKRTCVRQVALDK